MFVGYATLIGVSRLSAVLRTAEVGKRSNVFVSYLIYFYPIEDDALYF